MKKKKLTIKDLTIGDFISIIPQQEVERLLNLVGKREVKHFWDFMNGQTAARLEAQYGIYIDDLQRFLYFRKKNLTGKKIPVND